MEQRRGARHLTRVSRRLLATRLHVRPAAEESTAESSHATCSDPVCTHTAPCRRPHGRVLVHRVVRHTRDAGQRQSRDMVSQWRQIRRLFSVSRVGQTGRVATPHAPCGNATRRRRNAARPVWQRHTPSPQRRTPCVATPHAVAATPHTLVRNAVTRGCNAARPCPQRRTPVNQCALTQAITCCPGDV